MSTRVLPIEWAYGVTTVPERRHTLLPKTLASLKEAGFPTPRLFIDKCEDCDGKSWQQEFGLQCTIHGGDPIRTYGNWVLALAELYIRQPNAQRFAMFQDDFVTYRNLRQYLESCPFPEQGYLNLYLFPQNAPVTMRKMGVAWAPPDNTKGWYASNQRGRGAVALVFNREGVLALLTHQHMVERPFSAHRGHKSVDGGVVTAMVKMGWKEYVHNPTLVEHTGKRSSMGNPEYPVGVGFLGEVYNAMDLLEKKE